MSNEPAWDEIFSTQPDESRVDAPPPTTRRALREPDRGSRRSSRGGGGSRDGERPKRRLGWLWALLTVFVLFAGGAAAGWILFEDRIRDVLGWQEPNDFAGDGNGEPVDVVISQGDIGSDIAQSLVDAGVTRSFDAFYDLLIVLPEQPTFLPGTYGLEREMSAEAALEALLDPANRKVSTVTIPEGLPMWGVFARLSEGTGVPVEDFEAAAEDHEQFGVPAESPSIEGYLYPATYEFDPGTDASVMLQTLVNRTFQALDDVGVPEDDRLRVLTIASMLEREAGNAEDLYRVSTVVQNRLEEGMPLQFDSTSQYGYRVTHGTPESGSVFSSEDELTDDNPFNTYVHTGLPPGAIGAAGETAIDAALNPADGDWLYFVTVDLRTGETVFTETLREHERAVQQLREWCRASDENAELCA